MAIDFSKISLTPEALIIPAPVYSATAGAVVDFLGVVRGIEGADTLTGLEYEAYEAMAEIKLRQICGEIAERKGLENVWLIHRIGFVAVGEPSLFLRVTAGHRAEAYEGSREIIERLKQEVPIWKNPAISNPS